jgi:HTH-type transcriptional regulator / antitoxin HipB
MRVRTTEEIGLRIRDRRLQLGWSQAQLAERVGKTRQWVINLERGKPGAGLGLVLRVLSALDLVVDVRERARKGGSSGSAAARQERVRDQPGSLLDSVVERSRDPAIGLRIPGEAAPARRTPLRPAEQV